MPRAELQTEDISHESSCNRKFIANRNEVVSSSSTAVVSIRKEINQVNKQYILRFMTSQEMILVTAYTPPSHEFLPQ